MYSAGKIKALKKKLKQSGSRDNMAVISSCFIPDLISIFSTRHTRHTRHIITCASIRGNLPMNYQDSYGFFGRFLTYIHFKIYKKFDLIVSMTQSMATQVDNNVGSKSLIIGNFIDEKRLDKHRG